MSGWIPFKFPERIQMLSKSKAERAMRLSIGAKVRRKNHISAVRASKEIIPFLKIIFRNDASMAAGLARWLDLTKEMVEYLVGDEEKAGEVLKLMSQVSA